MSYSAAPVNFLPNPQKIYSKAHHLGRCMWCIWWIQTLMYTLPQWLWWCMQHPVILGRIKTIYIYSWEQTIDMIFLFLRLVAIQICCKQRNGFIWNSSIRLMQAYIKSFALYCTLLPLWFLKPIYPNHIARKVNIILSLHAKSSAITHLWALYSI